MSSRLLLVEDELPVAEFLVRGLTEEGYAVTHVADGRLAWIMLQRPSWDLVLLDWRLPGEDGLQILRRFRQQNQMTPVLFLTARDSIGDRVNGLDAGADDYLCKPFAFDELLARVRALLRRGDPSARLRLEFQDVQADLSRQQATRAGVELDLTAKEFLLLICFLRHPGRRHLSESVVSPTTPLINCVLR